MNIKLIDYYTAVPEHKMFSSNYKKIGEECKKMMELAKTLNVCIWICSAPKRKDSIRFASKLNRLKI